MAKLIHSHIQEYSKNVFIIVGNNADVTNNGLVTSDFGDKVGCGPVIWRYARVQHSTIPAAMLASKSFNSLSGAETMA